ncbi:MAG: PilZ domain-containing protein [Acidimicrobiia bacterium]|nr:PilZ domain-containing protein [Acidimicrobiia bacterium]
MSANNPNAAISGNFPRLSDRFSVDNLTLTWIVPNNRKLFGKKSAHVEVAVVDLSVAGALLVGPEIDVVRSGSRVPFIHEGEQGLAEVRHIRPADDIPGVKSAVYYGVVFLTLTDQLKTMIFDHIAARRGGRENELAELWNQSR